MFACACVHACIPVGGIYSFLCLSRVIDPVASVRGAKKQALNKQKSQMDGWMDWQMEGREEEQRKTDRVMIRDGRRSIS